MVAATALSLNGSLVIHWRSSAGQSSGRILIAPAQSLPTSVSKSNADKDAVPNWAWIARLAFALSGEREFMALQGWSREG
jgi:hypothetical protein